MGVKLSSDQVQSRARKLYDSAIRTAKKPFAVLKIAGLLDRNEIDQARSVQANAGLSDRTMIGLIDDALERFRIDRINPRHPLYWQHNQTDLVDRLKGLRREITGD